MSKHESVTLLFPTENSFLSADEFADDSLLYIYRVFQHLLISVHLSDYL